MATNFANKTKYTKLEGKKLYTQQFGALLLKRFHHYRRNLRILFTNILLPCAFVAISMALTTIKPLDIAQKRLEMTPAIYDPSQVFYTYKITKRKRTELFHFLFVLNKIFIHRFESTKNMILKSSANDYIRSFNSVCSNEPSRRGDLSSNDDVKASKLTLNSNLCGLISTEVIRQAILNE